MVARVPTVSRQIDAAAKGQLIVNHHDLLVMAGAYWMVIIESEADAAWHTPSEPPPRQRFTLERVQRTVIPDQDVDTQVRTPLRDKGDQRIEPGRRVSTAEPGREVDGRGDIPTEDEHRVARFEQRPSHQLKIVSRILDTVKAIRAVEPPAVPSGLDDRPLRTRARDRPGTLRGTTHSASLARRRARLTNHANVSGTPRNTAAVSAVPGDGSRSACVS